MNNLESSTESAETFSPRKPRIAIMGEFSVGKSTLTNLLIGSNPLPVRVTATQLPPVWMSYGNEPAFREDLAGNIIPIDIDELDQVPLEDTAVIRLYLESDILQLCDLIDMPGISDPNMSAEVWQRILHNADGVLWCTHATQAWRQSEAAVWKSMSPELFEKSFLLITRIDKLLTETDRQKVVKRVRRETEGMFAGLFPISLTEAIAGNDDRDLWELSGAENFTQCLVDLIHDLSKSLSPTETKQSASALQPAKNTDEQQDSDEIVATDANSTTAPSDSKVHRLDLTAHKKDPEMPSVMPTRVKVASNSGRARPRPSNCDVNAMASNRPAGSQQDDVHLAPNHDGL